MTFFDINIETLSKLTGFTESHLEGILKQDIIDKTVGKRIISSMNLTNNDYDWVHVVLHEVGHDRDKRIRALDEIRFKQRQQKFEKERVKKDDKESKKETESVKRVKARRGSKAEDTKVKTNRSKKVTKKRKGGQESEKADVQKRKGKSKQS
jgi:hypothetical protein